MDPFAGWPPEALEFLAELEADNDRDWFHANRPRYEAHVAGPARALGEQLEDLGTPKVFRPFNDVRFHPGPPIKEHVGLVLRAPDGGVGVGYVQLSLDGLYVVAGLHQPARDQLDRLRKAIDAPRTAASLETALKVARTAQMELGEPALKRAPRGYAMDHPRIELLRHKRLTVHRLFALEPWLHTPDAGDRIRAQLAAAQPLIAWLRAHVGPTTLPSRTR
jgi:uncharacterized protein (TIGR02453 family)